MDMQNVFVPEVASTSEPIRATVRTTTLTETAIEMPDGEVINEKLEATTVENMILVPKSAEESPDETVNLSKILNLECGKNYDIVLMSLFFACILLAIALACVVYKWRKERVQIVDGFEMLKRGSSVSVFNASKME